VSPIDWYIAIGLLLVSMAFTAPFFHRLPLSVSMLYLGVGIVLGPTVFGIFSWDMVQEAHLFEHVTEIAVIVSLFTVGLTMRRSLTDRMWLLPVRLASLTMIVTIVCVAAIGVFWLGLSLGAAVLLGAVLAPTDPVLASDVQLQDPADQDPLRYSISGEAGLNDGTAFPFVMLGLGMLGLHPDEEAGLFGLWANQPFSLVGWLGWDMLWAVAAGLIIGAATGWAVGQAALFLQRRLSVAFSLHEFLVLGLIALAYGLAELVYGYGFLAVFAAGYALRYIELRAAQHAPEPAELPPVTPGTKNEQLDQIVQEPQKATQFLAASLLDFNDKLEHLLMAAVLVLVGAVFTTDLWTWDALWIAALLFCIVRPVAVALGLIGTQVSRFQTGLIGWFGVRGIGSVYYLTYAISHGVSEPLADRLTSIVLSLIVVSVLVHGISVSPLMSWYENVSDQHRAERAQA
jgi:sodium/hydrogen antiporter